MKFNKITKGSYQAEGEYKGHNINIKATRDYYGWDYSVYIDDRYVGGDCGHHVLLRDIKGELDNLDYWINEYR